MKKLVYLFAMMMTIAFSFASCGGDDNGDESGNDSGQASSSGSIGNAESGNIVKTNDYYITPCLKWGMSMSDVKTKMAGSSDFTFSMEGSSSGNRFLNYTVNGSTTSSLMYIEYEGGLYGAMWTTNVSKIDKDGILSAVVADGYKLNETYTEGVAECHVYDSPSKKTVLLVIISGGSYILNWMNAAYY